MLKEQVVENLKGFVGKGIFVGMQTEFGIGKPPFHMQLIDVNQKEEGVELVGTVHDKHHEYVINENLLQQITPHQDGKGLSFHLSRSAWLSVSCR